MIVALVPARGQSKRIPRKNLAPLAGKPLLAWTLEAALAAREVTRVVVSTDDEEIAGAARSLGAEVPFLRPQHLATDEAPTLDAVLHALDWLEEQEGPAARRVMLLQPTSPLRTAGDIDCAARLLHETGASAVVSVCPAQARPYWFHRLGARGELLPADEGAQSRDDGAPLFVLNGAIYLLHVDVLRRERLFVPPGAVAYVMPPERSLDVDVPWDFHLADLVLRDQQRRAE